ncbi:MAG: hypothetical protein HRU11_04675 [Parvularculaceae bacterium]|nr:hypothetical protein [Parvularculaceae bacterium]
MLLAFTAFLILAWGLVARRLPASSAVRFRLSLIGGVTIVVAFVLILNRLMPLALLVLLSGAGLIANTLIRSLSQVAEDTAQPGAEPVRAAAKMDKAEALAVLGLEGMPDADAIKAAHKKMIVRAHPDQGGSAYLAAKVNQARDVLLDG